MQSPFLFLPAFMCIFVTRAVNVTSSQEGQVTNPQAVRSENRPPYHADVGQQSLIAYFLSAFPSRTPTSCRKYPPSLPFHPHFPFPPISRLSPRMELNHLLIWACGICFFRSIQGDVAPQQHKPFFFTLTAPSPRQPPPPTLRPVPVVQGYSPSTSSLNRSFEALAGQGVFEAASPRRFPLFCTLPHIDISRPVASAPPLPLSPFGVPFLDQPARLLCALPLLRAF